MLDGHALACSAAAPGTVFLANRMGLFRSEDGGSHWQDVDVGRFSPMTYGRDLRVSPHDPKVLYAALSPEQKRTFDNLPLLEGHGDGRPGNGGFGGHGRMGQGGPRPEREQAELIDRLGRVAGRVVEGQARGFLIETAVLQVELRPVVGTLG